MKEKLHFNSDVLMCQIYKELIVLVSFYHLDTNQSHLRRQNIYEKLLPSRWPVVMSLGHFFFD